MANASKTHRNLGKRFYTTEVTATDAAGLVGKSTCYVEILGNGKQDTNGLHFSAQRFLIDSFFSSKYTADPSPSVP